MILDFTNMKYNPINIKKLDLCSIFLNKTCNFYLEICNIGLIFTNFNWLKHYKLNYILISRLNLTNF